MKKNVGNTDRNVRLALGIVITATGVYFKSWWGALAIIPVATASTGLCPVYKILDVNTK